MGEADGAQELPPPEPTAVAVDTVCTARDACENDAADEDLETRSDQGTGTQAEEKPPSPPEEAEHAQADEAAAKPDDSEGSDTQSADGHGTSPRGEEARPAGATRGSASKSRLLAFQSFTRDKKAGDAAPPESVPRVPSPGGEPRPAARGRAGEDGADHRENGKDWRKRFWK